MLKSGPKKLVLKPDSRGKLGRILWGQEVILGS